MAGLTNHNPSTVLWQGQMGSKRILALNEIIRNVAECCWHFFLVLLCYRKGTSQKLLVIMTRLDLSWVNVKGVTVIFVDLPIQEYFSPVEAHKCWGRQPWMESVSYFALSSFWQIQEFVTMINIHPASFVISFVSSPDFKNVSLSTAHLPAFWNIYSCSLPPTLDGDIIHLNYNSVSCSGPYELTVHRDEQVLISHNCSG